MVYSDVCCAVEEELYYTHKPHPRSPRCACTQCLLGALGHAKNQYGWCHCGRSYTDSSAAIQINTTEFIREHAQELQAIMLPLFLYSAVPGQYNLSNPNVPDQVPTLLAYWAPEIDNITLYLNTVDPDPTTGEVCVVLSALFRVCIRTRSWT